MKKHISRIAKLIILLAVFIMLSLSVFLFTPIGLKITQQALNKYANRIITIENVQGSFLRDFTLENLTFQNKDLHLKAKNIRLAISFVNLLKADIKINHLTFDEIKIVTSKPATPSPSTKKTNNIDKYIKLFSYNLNDVNINNLKVYQEETPIIAVNNLTLIYKHFERADININYDYYLDKAQKISGIGKIQLGTDKDAPVTIDFTTKSPKNYANPFALDIKASGTTSNHSITIKSNYDINNFNLVVDGSFNDNQWLGDISKGSFKNINLISLNFLDNSQIIVNKKSLNLKDICLANKDISLCANGAIKTGKFSPPKLDLLLDVTSNNLDFIDKSVANIESEDAKLDLKFKIAGNVKKPSYALNLNLAAKTLKLIDYNSAINNLKLNIINTKTNTLEIKGEGKTKDGAFNLQGSHDIKTNSLKLNLVGENIHVVDTPEYEVIADPNLNLSFDNNNINLAGSIIIPYAKIALKDLNSAQKPSSDVVYVNQKPAKKSKLTFTTDLNIILGKKIEFSGFGLTSNLAGKLNINSSPNSPTLTTGKINTVNGKYKVFGKTLNIVEGNILYQNEVLSNPAIDVKAQKLVIDPESSEKITVGAKVSGNIQKPTLNFYSSPALENAEILSYIVLNKKPNQSSGAEADLLLQASLKALTIFNNKTSLKDDLEQFIGDYDLALETTDGTDNSSLNNLAIGLGKQLNDKLYLHYSFGLVEAISKIKLQYKLTDGLNLEASTSTEESGADLTYTFER